MAKPHIVILGAGFGGMYTAKKLKGLAKLGLIDLTIVNRTNYFLFTPLLHEVATGGLGPQSVAQPLREIFRTRGIKIIQGTVQSIDAVGRQVLIKSRDSVFSIAFDYAVLATGAETDYHDVPGAEKFTLPLKSLADAVRIRSEIIDSFEKAVLMRNAEERKRLLSFAVIGGGATGVELAAELAEFTKSIARRYFRRTNCPPEEFYQCRPEEVTITLIHSGSELLNQFEPELREAVTRRLGKKKINIRLSTTVVEVTPEGLTLKDETKIPAHTVIWTAGVKATMPTIGRELPEMSGGRVIVDQYFRWRGNDRIYVLGDAAAYVDVNEFIKNSSKTKSLPMLAQVAVAQARTVSRNIISAIKHRPLKNFHFKSKGLIVSVGRWFAVGTIFGVNFYGHLTWWLWRTIYLFKFASWPKRIRIMIDWTMDFFYPRDITKLT